MNKEDAKKLKDLREENATLKRAVEEMAILNDLARAVAGTTNVREILNTTVHRSLRALHAGQGVITLVDEDEEDPAKTFVRIVVRSSEKKEFHFNEGLLGWMQIHKKPLLLNDPRNDPHFKRIPWDEPVKSLLCAPMMVKARLTGVLTVYNPQGREFTLEDQRLLSIIAAHVAQVVENARLDEEKRSMQLQIARDLHDDVASSLSSIALYAESLKRQLGDVSRQALEIIEKMSALSLEAVDTMGDIVWSIAPEHDTLNDLFFRMKNHALELCSAKEIRTDIQTPEGLSDCALPVDVRRNIFLIFKEALNNVINHSQAQCVFVEVELRDGTFEMTIKDDGVGFSTDGVTRGHGLRNMEERAKEIHAKYFLVSKQGKGTEVRLSKKMT
jgi:signal transduction histidine kinase